MRRYGLIGRPLVHSASARYFAAKFAREGITGCRYDLFELDSLERLPGLLAALPDLCGFNVTIPYKRAILPFLDALSPEAERIGAVNCVRRDGDRLTGYNTDVAGLRSALGNFLTPDRPRHALVLGTGGASQAVQYVLKEMGIDFGLVSRDPGRGRFTYDNLPAGAVCCCRLIVNASPVGTYPHADEAPRLPYDLLTCRHYLFDLVYNPPLTRFLVCGRERGARICNGEGMFRAQAEAAWTIWNCP